MSRIGNKPVLIPEKIEMNLNGNSIIVKGPKGELTTEIVDERIKFEIKENELLFSQELPKLQRLEAYMVCTDL